MARPAGPAQPSRRRGHHVDPADARLDAGAGGPAHPLPGRSARRRLAGARREAGALVVGIRTGIEQHQREFVIAVLDRENERAGSSVWSFATGPARFHSLVHIDARFQQRANNLGVTITRGKEEGSEARIRQFRTDVRAGFDQQLYHFCVAIGCRPHQCRRAGPIACVQIGAFGGKETQAAVSETKGRSGESQPSVAGRTPGSDQTQASGAQTQAPVWRDRGRRRGQPRPRRLRPGRRSSRAMRGSGVTQACDSKSRAAARWSPSRRS